MSQDRLGNLLARVAGQDQDAFAILYDSTVNMVFGHALRILRDRGAADEAVHDVYLQIWQKANHYDPARGGPAGWILTLTRTRALDRLRRFATARHRELALDSCSSGVASADADAARQADLSERRLLVRDALARVSHEEREVLGCAYYRGLSHSEIASLLDQPLGTVKTRIRSGLLKLRQFLQPIETSN